MRREQQRRQKQRANWRGRSQKTGHARPSTASHFTTLSRDSEVVGGADRNMCSGEKRGVGSGEWERCLSRRSRLRRDVLALHPSPHGKRMAAVWATGAGKAGAGSWPAPAMVYTKGHGVPRLRWARAVAPTRAATPGAPPAYHFNQPVRGIENCARFAFTSSTSKYSGSNSSPSQSSKSRSSSVRFLGGRAKTRRRFS